jgi:hypothetical protein
MRRLLRKALLPMLGALGLLVASSGQGRADIILQISSVTSLVNGNALYTYDVVLSGGSSLRVAGGGSSPLVNAANFFTVYDFAGYVSGSASALANFTISEQNTGITPVGTAPTDDPTKLNVTYTYTGPNVDNPGFNGLLLGQISLESTVTTFGPAGLTFAGASQDSTFPARQIRNNLGQGVGPIPQQVIPEPASVALVGLGLPMLVLAGRRLHRKRV